MNWRHRLRAIFLALLAPAAASGAPETNFSQWPGFARYFAEHPLASALPNAEERALLNRFRPRILLPDDHPGLVDFYSDYIANGSLFDGEGKFVSDAVTPDLLNRFKSDPRAEFRHRPPDSGSIPARVLARIDRAELGDPAADSGASEKFVFLTYNAVFRHSGLPRGLKGWKAALLGLVADLRDWHQLDHYTAVSVVLDADQIPVAVMMQQHNDVRTFLIGEGIELPADGRVRIDAAIRSNELYPHIPGRQRRRAVRFADRDAMAHLMGFGNRPFLSADDITHGADEVDYALGFLPPSDAFYMFQGFLGERRLLPGRSGPPGASYNTLPELKPLALQLSGGYWREDNPADWRRFRNAHSRGEAAFAEAQAPVLLHNLRCLRAGRSGCELR